MYAFLYALWCLVGGVVVGDGRGLLVVRVLIVEVCTRKRKSFLKHLGLLFRVEVLEPVVSGCSF
ncbi:hypothetical protein D6783_01020 [Candidatus Woesearchaeota archaeon]|nr:MAG: hypothetical protein D6783_01020 [Candidatus Woesearchaeota archaeon]